MSRVSQAIREMPSVDAMLEKKPGTKPFRRAANLGYWVGALAVVGVVALLFPGDYPVTAAHLVVVSFLVLLSGQVGIVCAVAAMVGYQMRLQR